MTEAESRLDARLVAAADALEDHLAEAERELPVLPRDRLEPCRLAALRIAHAAAALVRQVHRAMGLPE